MSNSTIKLPTTGSNTAVSINEVLLSFDSLIVTVASGVTVIEMISSSSLVLDWYINDDIIKCILSIPLITSAIMWTKIENTIIIFLS